MTRTQRNQRGLPASHGKSTNNIAQRRSQVSRSLSKVLRHQAENERIPITKEGWVRVSDLLAWRGLSDPSKFNPPINIGEIMDVVEEDGINGKGRFGLKLAYDQLPTTSNVGTIEIDGAATGEILEAAQSLHIAVGQGSNDAKSADEQKDHTTQVEHSEGTSMGSKNSPETLAVILYQSKNPNEPASTYLIRATQGHSIKTIESEGLLIPISLDDPSSIPTTVVHGTFYGAWKSILSSGGLRPMSRNMVHFASGPIISEVLPPTDTTEANVSMKSKQEVESVLSQNKVISGMRWDAQILIYIDIKRMLQDAKDQGWEMKWWRSDNGVILTEGVIIPAKEEKADQAQRESTQADLPQATAEVSDQYKDMPPEEKATARKAHKEAKRLAESQSKPTIKPQRRQITSRAEKLVPLEYFEAAVEIKAGVGVLWRAGEGVVHELPEHLSSKGVPRGKGPRNKGAEASTGRGGKQDKPRVRVERDTDLRADIGIEAD